MDIMLELPQEQLLFYTNNINDKYIKEKAKERGFAELFELLSL